METHEPEHAKEHQNSRHPVFVHISLPAGIPVSLEIFTALLFSGA